MPTNRKRRTRSTVTLQYDDVMRVHLEQGDCLLASAGPGLRCACGLIDANGTLLVDEVRRQWRAHKNEILANWQDEELPWASQYE